MGAVVISWQDDQGGSGTVEVMSGTLGPGEISPMFQVTYHFVTEVELTLEPDDCNSENGPYAFSNPDGLSICL